MFCQFFWQPCWRRSDENGCVEFERRHERSRGGYWEDVDVICSASASSAQLKRSEMSENGGFSTFMQFSMKLVEAGRVFEAETILVDAKDSVGSFDSKTAREHMLFSCSVLVARCGELATVVGVED